MTTRDAGRVVIVGGGLSGYSAADALRDLGHSGSITIVDREAAMYDRPPLSKEFLAGHASRDSLEFSTADRLRERAITLISGRSVAALSVPDLSVELDDGTRIAADSILLATGGRARRLPIPGGDDSRVHVLRTVGDAERLRAAVGRGTRVVLIGAGLIGSEIASALRELGGEVTLVDPVEVPLIPAVGEVMAASLHEMHAVRGIRTVHAGISGIEAGDRLEVILESGERVAADLVLVGVGIEPNVELAEAAGLETGNGILIDDAHRTSAPGIYAAGDVSRRRGADGLLERREEHWEAAQLGGRAAAAGMLGLEAPARGAGWFWSDRHGVHVEAVGRLGGSGETVLRQGPDQAIPTVFQVEDGLLVGAVAVDDTLTIRAARRIIDQRIPISPVELADPSISLKGLLRASR